MSAANITFAEVVLNLATEEAPHIGNAIALLAGLAVEREKMEKKIASLEDEAADKAETITALRRELEIEQGKVGIVAYDHKKQADQLVAARNLLADWLAYSDPQAIATATQEFLEELSK